ncbi:MAG: sigma-70 family RNA polymerase sigma factor [Chloroflexi bacterium]|nr:MAG: sigma-70 family RNA polymerase sigma factor [Chloroflexota bacterium]
MKLDSVADTVLIQLIAGAHADALKELYDRYNRLVFSVALAILGDRSVAEEATLDVFVHVWRGARTYRPDRAKVSTWLVAITRHHAIDILRWQNSRLDGKSLSLNDMLLSNESAVPAPEALVETSLEQARVRDAVAQLPAEQRQVLTLAYFRGYTHQQIAEVLEQPLGTVKTRIRLAMQKLRQMLMDEHQVSDKSEGT